MGVDDNSLIVEWYLHKCSKINSWHSSQRITGELIDQPRKKQEVLILTLTTI